jgi:hypothetical protein
MKPKNMILTIAIILSLGTGYWMGYWHGRTYELYLSAKKYNAIPADMTWEQFLDLKSK